MGTVNPDFTSKGAGFGEPSNVNVGGNTGYTVTVTSSNAPHTELVRQGDSLASGTTVGSHDFYAGDSTKTKVASIDVVVSGTSEDSASMVLRTANAGVMSDGLTISSGGTVTLSGVTLDTVTATTVDVTTLVADTANITTTNTTTMNATLVSATSVAATAVNATTMTATGVVTGSTVVAGAATLGLVAATTVTISGGYANLTSTAGDTGVGLRLNSGTVEFKNTAGSWQAVAAATTTAGGWTDTGTYIHLSTGTDDVILGVAATPSAKLELVDTAAQLKLTNSSTSLGVIFNTDSVGNTTLDSDGTFTLPVNTAVAGATLGTDSYRDTWPASSNELLRLIAKRTAVTNIIDAAVLPAAGDADAKWRKNQAASWWSEAFSATRGSSKDFPGMAYAVATSSTVGAVQIIDATTGAVWMSFNGDSIANHVRDPILTSISYDNGVLATSGTSTGLCVLDFVKDCSVTCANSTVYWANGGIASRNAGAGHVVDTLSAMKLVNASVSAVDTRVISGVTYIVAGTAGGVTIIDWDNQTAWDSAVTSAVSAVAIDADGYVVFRCGDVTYRSSSPVQGITADSWAATTLVGPAAGTVSKLAVIPAASVVDGTSAVIAQANQTAGLELLHLNASSVANPWIARHTTTYRHPPLHKDASVWSLHNDPSGGTVTDVSGNGVGLTAMVMEAGDKTALVTGSDLNKYTFDGAAEYLTQTMLHTEADSGAAFNAFVGTDGSASITIDDSDTDLQAAYQTLVGNSAYVIVVLDDAATPKRALGYIRAISSAAGTYGFTVNNTAAGGTQNWIKESGFNDSAATYTWRIYNARTFVTGAFTAMVLFSLAAAPGTVGALIGKGDGSATATISWTLRIDATTGTMTGLVYLAAASATATSPANVCDGQFHLAMIRYTPGVSLDIGLDGEKIASDTSSVPASINNVAYPVRAGASGSGGSVASFFGGSLGMPMYIPGVAITDAQFRRIWQSLKPSLVTSSVGNLAASNVVKSVSFDNTTRSLMVGQDSGATGSAQIFSVDGGMVYTDTINTSDSDDTGTAITSARTLAVAADSGLAVVGTTAEVFARGMDAEATSLGERVQSVTAGTTLASGITKLLVTTGTTDVTIGLPALANIRNRVAEVWKVDSGAGVVVIDGDGSETINGLATVSLSTQWTYKNLTAYGSGWLAK